MLLGLYGPQEAASYQRIVYAGEICSYIQNLPLDTTEDQELDGHATREVMRGIKQFQKLLPMAKAKPLEFSAASKLITVCRADWALNHAEDVWHRAYMEWTVWVR